MRLLTKEYRYVGHGHVEVTSWACACGDEAFYHDTTSGKHIYRCHKCQGKYLGMEKIKPDTIT